MNIEMEKRAIECLKAFEPQDEQGYYLCYSGGKDGDTVRLLAQLAGVKHQCKHNLTTADAPETVYYIRNTIGNENIIPPPLSIWRLIVKKCIPPSRRVRYCCSALKEIGGKGQVKITGVRKAESSNRRAKKEGKIHAYRDWHDLVRPDSDKLILMDNNILACDYGLKQLESLIDSGYKIDLNQGMDARLVTDEIAQILSKLKWIRFLRFSCDSIPQIAAIHKTAEML